MNPNQSLSKFIWNGNLLKAAVVIFALILFGISTTFAQSLSRIERGQAKDMLNAVRNEIKNKYYDPTFRGLDLEARFRIAEEKLDKAVTLGQAFGIIAQAVLELNDSHTTLDLLQK